ncbi:MAG: thioredoxin domain-containing protein [Pirellulales bacterium]
MSGRLGRARRSPASASFSHPAAWRFRLRIAVAFAAVMLSVVGPAQADEPPAKAPAAAKPAGKHRNRLARETSPYLLLHAHNPVDWYPWGEEALARAKQEQKLIFLSIGYSSCHWCHVMERESFLDEEIAALLNKHFVCIKVDREERPDVDAVYMTSLHVFNRLTGNGRGGGWPLSMFLTPDAEPFFGGTYFPPRDGDRGSRIGFLTLLKRIHELWEANGDKLRDDGKTLSRYVKQELEQPRSPLEPVVVSPKLLDESYKALSDNYDAKHGGFGFDEDAPGRPKFPEPSNLMLLTEHARRAIAAGDATPASLRQLVDSLDHMARGGIRDHLGGGFHRYSVDRYWRIPHFEKMLYDNAQLLTAYSEAYSLAKRPDFRRIVAEIIEFAERELAAPQGGYFAALDAESEGEEGRYYRWEKDELRGLLNDDDWSFAAPAYGWNGEPNFEEKFYVPQFGSSVLELAAAGKMEFNAYDDRLQAVRAKLLAARSKRPRPLTDTKVLTSWNGLMVRGLADAGRNLSEPKYVAAAERTAAFLLEKHRLPDGRLARTSTNGQPRLNAYLDDYAFLIDGLLALHKATADAKWLDAAAGLQEEQDQWYWDERQGGYFFTSHNHESLLARAKEVTDGAEPAGNSVSACNLAYLAQHHPNPEARRRHRDRAVATIQSAALLWTAAPGHLPRLAIAASELPAP